VPYNPFVEYRRPILPVELKNISIFLKYLSLSDKEYRAIRARKYAQYSLTQIKKRSGGERTISIPNERLKFVQRQIYELLGAVYKPRNCIHGFVKNKSAISNAAEHLGRQHLVEVDLKNYFDQITTSRIMGVLSYLGVDKEVSIALTTLVTLGNCLPQGSPCSPILANMVTFALDQQLLRFSKANRVRYSRYADDIVLSSHSRPRFLRPSVENNYVKLKIDDLDKDFLNIFSMSGFDLNEDKMYYCGPGSRRCVTGITINEFANVPRSHVRRVRSILHNIERNGFAAEQVKFAKSTKSIKSLKTSLCGQINWIGQTKGPSDPIYRKLALRYNSFFQEELKVGPDLGKLSTLSTWVIESEASDGMPESQGSCFFLSEVGLITAEHCLPPHCKYWVFSVDAPSEKFPVTVKARHKPTDLAVLSHSIPSSKFIEVQMALRELNVGEQVISWGFPAHGPGKRLTEKIGRVAAHHRLSGVEMYSVDLKLYPGTSGGPILNAFRQVVGVTHKGGDGEAHDLAVKIKYILEL